MSDLETLSWGHGFFDRFPLDESRAPGSRQVSGAFGSLVDPTPVARPSLVGWSQSFSKHFGLSRPDDASVGLRVLAGNQVLPGMKPLAACYGGHQFGHWAGQLGDGRAISLGEAPDLKGNLWEFQLKGAGPTPYSRRADGRAVLRSSIREFICSEAMFHLGVPTTRALSVVSTGEPVVRDMFYDGHPKEEPGAIVCRVSPSFLRFGNFQIFAARGETQLLRTLVDETMNRFFPELSTESPAREAEWFRIICERTAVLMGEWMRVGFVHGVMNTDNMSILGLTIDYGPYGWLDDYDPSWTPNTTDLPGRRYCYGRQPAIGLWNLTRLAEALLTLVPEQKDLFEESLASFQGVFQKVFLRSQAQKLGLKELDLERDEFLIVELDRLLTESQADMTLFYRELATGFSIETAERSALPDFLPEVFYAGLTADLTAAWTRWFQVYADRLRSEGQSPENRLEMMNAVNPLYVPRNYLVQEAIESAEVGDFSKVEELLAVLESPYVFRENRESYAKKRPDWARSKPGCSTLSCSS
ncbi:MAG: YdiU family protein [Bdellovibrionaceae bacterium]|nr:YdiU family protein [Pseudobdellovibrionaceae bacterium]